MSVVKKYFLSSYLKAKKLFKFLKGSLLVASPSVYNSLLTDVVTLGDKLAIEELRTFIGKLSCGAQLTSFLNKIYLQKELTFQVFHVMF